jgi:hypothetical protein
MPTELIVVLVLIAVVAIIWFLRKESAKAEEQRKVDEFRRLRDAADAQDRAAMDASAVEAPARPAARSGDLLQEAADRASGLRYERAADRLDAMTADLAEARAEADHAAARQAGRAGAALAAVQAAAAAHGGAVPGDGTRDCPPGYPIKGNLPSQQYYESGQRGYAQVIPDVCFQSVAAAEAADFAVSGTGDDVIVDEIVDVVDIGDERPASAGIAAAAVAAADAGGVPPGAIRGDGSRECPSAYPIKGNSQSMLYHEPGSATYQATVAEFCFSSVQAAETAGFAATRF